MTRPAVQLDMVFIKWPQTQKTLRCTAMYTFEQNNSKMKMSKLVLGRRFKLPVVTKLVSLLVLVAMPLIIVTYYDRAWIPRRFSDRSISTPPADRYLVRGVNCASLIKGNQSEINRVNSMSNHYVDQHRKEINSFLYDSSMDCQTFKTNRGYVTSSLSKEEADFPIAFGIMVYTDIDRLERLLRSIYRPQNFYCIHMDKTSTESFKRGTRRIANCFHNVFISSRFVDVVWGEFSVLEGDLVCMQDLLKYKWKYLINLTGQEFPLKTNRQMVKILKSYRGANDIGGSANRLNHDRVAGRGKPPYNVTLMKGPMHVAASRGFVEFIFRNRKAQGLLKWLKRTSVPDETFYATINNNPQLGAPGAFGGPSTVRERMTSAVRFKQWEEMPCSGKYVRGICIFNVGDLQRLGRSKDLFANKFLSNYGQYAYDCLEELFWNRTLEEYRSNADFDTIYYSNLPFVRYRATNTGKSHKL